jgi:predicted lactoylglutathione lyase
VTVPQRLTMVTLGVADVARSTSFYESLGWRRSSASQPTITFFTMQGSVLGLYGRDDLAADASVPAGGSGFRAVTLALNCAGEAEVDVVFAEWLAAGATAVKQPERVEWGGYSSYVADPDGHLWEIAYNPYSPNDESGRMQLPA